MDFGIAFAPLVPVAVLWAAIAAVIVLAALLLFIRSRGAPLRIAALALLVFAQDELFSIRHPARCEVVDRVIRYHAWRSGLDR